MEFKTLHKSDKWGQLVAARDGEASRGVPLVSVADLVCNLAACRSLPYRAAAEVALDALQAHGLALYLTALARAAERICEATVIVPEVFAKQAFLRPIKSGWATSYRGETRLDMVPKVDAKPGLFGPSGAIECARKNWAGRALAKPEHLHVTAPLHRLAVGLADAQAVFPDLFPAVVETRSSPPHQAPLVAAAAGLAVQPREAAAASGIVTWPHGENTAWTDAERVAMFQMRHRDGKSGDAIAEVVGVSRQRIDEQIGPKKLVGDWLNKLSWCPSAALLKECGIALQPLQSIAESAA